MPCDSIQGQVQGHGGPNIAEMAAVYLLHWYVCNKKSNGEL